MKRIIVLLAFVLTAGFVNAQSSESATTTKPAAEKAHAKALQMQKLLTLSEEQTANVEAVYLAKFNAIESVKADASKTQEQKDAAIEQIRIDKENEMLALLTPDQVQKYNEIKQQRQERKQASGQAEE